MEKRTIVLYVGALVFGATTYFLIAGRASAPAAPESVTVPVPVAAGEIKQLNEVVIQMPPPAAVSSEKPAVKVAATPANNNPPPPLGSEFDPILNGPTPMKGLHELFEREPREEPWASLMEGKWNIAFNANPELLAYGTPTVHCRTTRCEVQLVANGTPALDQTGWFALVIKGAGTRPPGDQSVPLVTGIRQSLPVVINNNGATVILLNYEYQREPPPGK